MIDGGANTGNWSLALLKQAVDKKLKKVVMIEPNDDHGSTHQLLHENYPGIVSMEWVALGSQTGTMTLYSNKV